MSETKPLCTNTNYIRLIPLFSRVRAHFFTICLILLNLLFHSYGYTLKVNRKVFLIENIYVLSQNNQGPVPIHKKDCMGKCNLYCFWLAFLFNKADLFRFMPNIPSNSPIIIRQNVYKLLEFLHIVELWYRFEDICITLESSVVVSRYAKDREKLFYVQTSKCVPPAIEFQTCYGIWFSHDKI